MKILKEFRKGDKAFDDTQQPKDKHVHSSNNQVQQLENNIEEDEVFSIQDVMDQNKEEMQNKIFIIHHMFKVKKCEVRYF